MSPQTLAAIQVYHGWWRAPFLVTNIHVLRVLLDSSPTPSPSGSKSSTGYAVSNILRFSQKSWRQCPLL